MSQEVKIPNVLKFVFGGLSGMGSTTILQPMDVMKNRMQLAHDKSHSFTKVFREIVKNEGFFALYRGISAGLFKQVTYTTTRIGIFTYLFDLLKTRDGTPPGFFKKLTIGLTAGAGGSLVGTPAEVCLVRIASDGRLPPSERRNYKHVFDALVRIYREEGLLTLWRGVFPTMGRAMIVNASQLGCYTQVKELLTKHLAMQEGVPLHFGSAMIAGLVTSITALPVDIAKTTLQTMQKIDGVPEYSGALDVLTKTVTNEGILALWKGFTPFYLFIGPHTLFTLLFLEQFHIAYYRYAMRKPRPEVK